MGLSVSLGNFDTQLGITYSKHASGALNKDHWVVKKQFHFAIYGDQNKTVTIPKGFLTDGASVPRLFWGLIPPWGAYGQAAVLHDYLCENLNYSHYGELVKMERSEADFIFKLAMEELGVSKSVIGLMYGAVRSYTAIRKHWKPKDYSKKRMLEAELLRVFNSTKIWI